MGGGGNNYTEYSLPNSLIKNIFSFLTFASPAHYLNLLTCTILLVGKILSSGNCLKPQENI